jgi:hypothetical protein
MPMPVNENEHPHHRERGDDRQSSLEPAQRAPAEERQRQRARQQDHQRAGHDVGMDRVGQEQR